MNKQKKARVSTKTKRRCKSITGKSRSLLRNLFPDNVLTQFVTTNSELNTCITCDFDLQNSDHSSESILIEERVNKLLDIDRYHEVERRNIFNNAEKNVPPIRRSVIGRTLRNRKKIISSTPMVKHAGNIYSTDCSLNLSPIDRNIDVDEEGIHPVQGEIKTTEQDIVVVDSSDEHDAYEAINASKNYNTRGRSNQLVSNLSQLKTRDIESAGKYSDVCNTRKEDNSKQMQKSPGRTRNNKSGSKLNSEIKKNGIGHDLSERQLIVKLATNSLTTLDKTSCESLKRNRNISMTLQSETVAAKPLNKNASCPVSKCQQSQLLNSILEINENHLENAEKILTPAKSVLEHDVTIKNNTVLKESLTKKNITTEQYPTLLRSPQIQENSSQRENLVIGQNQIIDQFEYNSQNRKSIEERISKIPILRNRSKSRENVEKVDPVNLRTMETPSKETNPYTHEEVPSKHHNKSREENKIPPKPQPRRKIFKKPKTPKSQENNNDIRTTPGTSNISRNNKKIESRLTEDIGNSINFESSPEEVKNSKTPISQSRKSNNAEKSTPITNNSKNNMKIQNRLVENIRTSINFETVPEVVKKIKTPISQLRKSYIAEKSNNLEKDSPGTCNNSRNNKEIQSRFMEDIGNSIDYESASEEVNKSKTPISQLRKSNNAKKSTPINDNLKNNKEVQTRSVENIGSSINFQYVPEEVKKSKTPIITGEKSSSYNNMINTKETQTISAEDIGNPIPDEVNKTRSQISQLQKCDRTEKNNTSTNYSKNKEIQTRLMKDIGTSFNLESIPEKEKKIKTPISQLQKSNNARKSNSSTNNLKNNKEIQTELVEDIGNSINLETDEVNKPKTPIYQSRKSNKEKGKHNTNNLKNNEEIQPKLMKDIGTSINFKSVHTCTSSNSSDSSELSKQEKSERLNNLISRFQEKMPKNSCSSSTETPKTRHTQVQTSSKKLPAVEPKHRFLRNSVSKKIISNQTLARSRRKSMMSIYDMESSGSSDQSYILKKHENEGIGLFSSPQNEPDYFTSSDEEYDMYNRTDNDVPWRFEPTSFRTSNRFSAKLNFIKSAEDILKEKHIGNVSTGGITEIKRTKQVYARESHRMTRAECARTIYQNRGDDEELSDDAETDFCADEPTLTEELINENIAESPTNIDIDQGHSVDTPRRSEKINRPNDQQQTNCKSKSRIEHKNIRESLDTSVNKSGNTKTYEIRRPCVKKTTISPEESINVPHEDHIVDTNFENIASLENTPFKNNRSPHLVNKKYSENRKPIGRKQSLERSQDEYHPISPGSGTQEEMIVQEVRPVIDFEQITEEPLGYSNIITDNELPDNAVQKERNVAVHIISVQNIEPIVLGPKHGPIEDHDSHQNLLPDGMVDQNNKRSPTKKIENDVNSASRSVEKRLMITSNNSQEEPVFKVPKTKSRKHNQKRPTKIIADDSETHDVNEKTPSNRDNPAQPISRGHSRRKLQTENADVTPLLKTSGKSPSVSGIRRSSRARRQTTRKYGMNVILLDPSMGSSRKSTRASKAVHEDEEDPLKQKTTSKSTSKRSKSAKRVDALDENKCPRKRITLIHSSDGGSEQLENLELESDDDYLRRPAPSNTSATSFTQTSVLNGNTMDVTSSQTVEGSVAKTGNRRETGSRGNANSEENNDTGISPDGRSSPDIQRHSMRTRGHSTRDVSEVIKAIRIPTIPEKSLFEQPEPSSNVVIEEQEHRYFHTHEQPISSIDSSPRNYSVNFEDPVDPMEDNVSQGFESNSNVPRLATEDNVRRSSLKMNSLHEKRLHSTKGSRVTKKRKNKKESTTGSPETVLKALRKISIDPENAEVPSVGRSEKNEYIDVTLNEENVRLKFIENEPNFRFRRDNHLASDPLQATNGSTTGFLKLPPGSKKPPHSSKKHILCFFVVQGKGEIRVQNCTNKVKTFSRFIVPVGIDYSISNESEDEPLILGYVRMGGAKTQPEPSIVV